MQGWVRASANSWQQFDPQSKVALPPPKQTREVFNRAWRHDRTSLILEYRRSNDARQVFFKERSVDFDCDDHVIYCKWVLSTRGGRGVSKESISAFLIGNPFHVIFTHSLSILCLRPCGEYLLEYRYVQIWIIGKKMKAEPSRLMPRKLTKNLERLIEIDSSTNDRHCQSVWWRNPQRPTVKRLQHQWKDVERWPLTAKLSSYLIGLTLLLAIMSKTSADNVAIVGWGWKGYGDVVSLHDSRQSGSFEGKAMAKYSTWISSVVN